MTTHTQNTALDIAELARAHAQAAIAVIAEIMNDPEVAASTRLSAAKTMLDLSFGKVKAAKRGSRAAPGANRVVVECHLYGDLDKAPRLRVVAPSPSQSGAPLARQSLCSLCGGRRRPGKTLPALSRRSAAELSRGVRRRRPLRPCAG